MQLLGTPPPQLRNVLLCTLMGEGWDSNWKNWKMHQMHHEKTSTALLDDFWFTCTWWDETRLNTTTPSMWSPATQPWEQRDEANLRSFVFFCLKHSVVFTVFHQFTQIYPKLETTLGTQTCRRSDVLNLQKAHDSSFTPPMSLNGVMYAGFTAKT